MINTHLISAFPGTGKSYFCYYDADYMPAGYAIDSDSSKFDKKHFPDNYIQHIKQNIGKVSIIFISSHKVVRDALVANRLPFKLVYPERELKAEYLQRYKDRGSSEAFISLIESNWDNWIDELEIQEGCHHIRLGSNQFLRNTNLMLNSGQSVQVSDTTKAK
jgi:hypothetical protein